MGRLGMSG
jgi:glyoxylase-like metal-dependent hydrolase (beta-lactamase superfamily II)